LISAVEYCHACHVAHRDLKLDNTLLNGEEPPQLRICDFGFAKSWGDDSHMLTQVGGLGGLLGGQQWWRWRWRWRWQWRRRVEGECGARCPLAAPQLALAAGGRPVVSRLPGCLWRGRGRRRAPGLLLTAPLAAARPWLLQIGTPVYMSPQLIISRSSKEGYDGKKSDVWAGGVLLFVMLLGEQPAAAAAQRLRAWEGRGGGGAAREAGLGG
jgi:serine/threonine protein kinase